MTPTVNGLDPKAFPPIAFVDLDGVVFEEGTDRFVPGAEDHLRVLARTHRIVFFTCRDAGSWVPVVLRADIPVYGHMPKPLACSYLFVDDRLDLAHCGNYLHDAVGAVIASSPVWKRREEEEKELMEPNPFRPAGAFHYNTMYS